MGINCKRKLTKNKTTHIAEDNQEMSPETDISIYAKSEEEALAKYNKYCDLDPYPHIAAALLNSADIAAYVKATALIYPFYQDRLKGASYDVSIKGDVVYWQYNNKGKMEKSIIKIEKDGDYFDLKPNSIAFVTMEPIFRIPSYLALRFNLKISHIYKGLLLGTGPLVDPGFCGRLYIPLHNLTANTYRFSYNDELITMEFTKMSANVAWTSDFNAPHHEKYVKNEIKSNRKIDDYIAKALKNDRLNHVISSIPDAVNDCKQEVNAANNAAKKAKRTTTIQAAISIIAVCTLVITAVGMSINAITKSNERYDEFYKEYADMKISYQQEIEDLKREMEELTLQIKSQNCQEDANYEFE